MLAKVLCLCAASDSEMHSTELDCQHEVHKTPGKPVVASGDLLLRYYCSPQILP